MNSNQLTFFREFSVAEVKFVHAPDCELGQQYGSCSLDCKWQVVRVLPKKMVEPRAWPL